MGECAPHDGKPLRSSLKRAGNSPLFGEDFLTTPDALKCRFGARQNRLAHDIGRQGSFIHAGFQARNKITGCLHTLISLPKKATSRLHPACQEASIVQGLGTRLGKSAFHWNLS